tara:strand:- start:2615 stop:6364 length:3750 start_codon:yes stop_codon:yes gene_type:complete
MATGCETNKNNLEKFILNQEQLNNDIDTENRVLMPNIDIEAIEKEFEDIGLDRNEIIPEEALNDAFKKLYGTKSESVILATKIYSLLEASPHLLRPITNYIEESIPKNVALGAIAYYLGTGANNINQMITPQEYDNLSKSEQKEFREERQIDLTNLNKNTLMKIYSQVFGMVNRFAGNKKLSKKIAETIGVHGNIGGFRARFNTPGQLQFRDPTGAYSIIADATRDYTDKIATRINLFFENPEFLPDEFKKEFKYKRLAKSLNKSVEELTMKEKRQALKLPDISRGMKKILSSVELIIESFTQRNKSIYDKENIVRLFQMIMLGEAYIDNGKIYVYDKYKAIYNDLTKDVERYETTGDAIFTFQDPVLIKDYTPDGQKKGSLEMKGLTKKNLDMLEELSEEARILDDAVFEYNNKYMKDSVDSVFAKLKESLPSLTEEQLKTLFFRKDTPLAQDLEKSLESSDPETYKKYKLLSDTFGSFLSDESVIAHGGTYGENYKYKQKHWPTLYHIDAFQRMLDRYKADMQIAVDSINETIEEEGETKELLKELRDYEGKLNAVTNIVDNMDGYHIDMAHNQVIPLMQDNKHFKRISNAYNLKQGRRDGAVYYDYLQNNMASIERNFMISELIGAMNIANDSKRISQKNKDAIIDNMVNLFKVPFQANSVKGFFGQSNESISNFMNWFGQSFGVNISPERINRNFRIVGSYLTGRYLSNPLTSPLTNMFGAIKNINDYGLKNMTYAISLYDGEHKDKINKIIALAGITQFSDFFSASMVSGIIGVQLEEKVNLRILQEMLQFHSNYKKYKRNRKIKNPLEKAEQEFYEAIEPFLSQSQAYMKAEEVILLSKERVKRRKKDVKLRMKLSMVNKFVQFAITKEYELGRVVKNRGFMKEFMDLKDAALQKTVGGLAGFISSLSKRFNLTMSDTESFVRSVSFIIGAQRAFDTELLSNKDNVPWYDIKDENDLQKLIKIGRTFSYMTNYGLSTQAVGQYNYNGFGNLAGKFTYWSQQAYGRDQRYFYDAYNSLKSIKNVESDSFDMKAILKLIGKLAPRRPGKGKKYRADLETAAPEVAMLRRFLQTQGLFTLLWDFVFAGPTKLLKPIAPDFFSYTNNFLRASGLGTLRSATSDLMSLIYFAPMMVARRLIYGNWFGDDDDEDDKNIDDTISWFTRKVPIFGFLWGWSFDVILTMLYKNAEANDIARKRLKGATSPLGAPIITPNLINPAIDIILDEDEGRGGWGRKAKKKRISRYFD